jgi:hypothetical protein
MKDATLVLGEMKGEVLVSPNFLTNEAAFTRNSSAGAWVNGVFVSFGIDVPRFGSLSSTSLSTWLLLEGQRTNSIRNSTMVGAGVGIQPTNWGGAVASNIGGSGVSTNVVGVGSEFGLNYVDINISGTSTSGGGISVSFDGISAIAALNAQTWTESFYLKQVSGDTTGLNIFRPRFSMHNAASGFLGALTGDNIISSIPVDKDRVVYTAALNQADTAFVRPQIELTWASGQVIDFTFRIYALQMEQGEFASSFIPTSTAAVTRAIDVAQIDDIDIKPWYTPEFRISGSFQILQRSGTPRVFAFHDGSNDNVIEAYIDTDGLRLQVVEDGNSEFNIVGGQFTTGDVVDFVIEVKSGAYSISVDGAAPVSNAYASVPTVDALRIGDRFGGDRTLFGAIGNLTFEVL